MSEEICTESAHIIFGDPYRVSSAAPKIIYFTITNSVTSGPPISVHYDTAYYGGFTTSKLDIEIQDPDDGHVMKYHGQTDNLSALTTGGVAELDKIYFNQLLPDHEYALVAKIINAGGGGAAYIDVFEVEIEDAEIVPCDDGGGEEGGGGIGGEDETPLGTPPTSGIRVFVQILAVLALVMFIYLMWRRL